MGICCVTTESEEKYEPLIIKDKGDKTVLADFESLRVVGSGTFGKVIMVKKRNTEDVYAMKVLKKRDIEQRNQRKHTTTERDVLASIKSPFIVQLHYAFQTQDKLFFIMEYLNGGELFYHLRKEGKFSEARTQFYAAEIVLGIECLHEHGVMYRDLKPENVMLDMEGHVKLTDFGLSKKENQGKTYTFCGTPEYLAPEIISGIGHNRSVDWWSLGALIYEMLAGIPPFRDANRKQLLKDILEKDVQMDPCFSPNAVNLLTGLLCRNPKLRLGGSERDAKEIKEHQFFEGINWKDLAEKKVPVPFKPPVNSNQDCSNFDQHYASEDVEEKVEESLPWKKEIIYDGFTYKGDCGLNESTLGDE